MGTAEVAKAIGVSKNTLLRWLAEGLLPDVARDWRGWRTWSALDIERARQFKVSYHEQTTRGSSHAAGGRDWSCDLGRSMYEYGQGLLARAGRN